MIDPAEFPESGQTMPVLFVGHGSPMNAIEDTPFGQAWREAGSALPKPEAILCVSAHWETRGTGVTAMDQPRTIHDFGGFPPELFRAQYPAPGSPSLAEFVRQTASEYGILPDLQWGLDHGTWSVLMQMFPAADIPVVQLSLDSSQPPEYHYRLGRALRALRRRGVLVLGSGNIVHNLRMIAWDDKSFDWAIEADETMRDLLEKGDDAGVLRFPEASRAARLAVPTREHFYPLLYILGLRGENEEPQFFADQISLGSLSMRSVRYG
jgi:4,5-DOPA dioxygenase extradiol